MWITFLKASFVFWDQKVCAPTLLKANYLMNQFNVFFATECYRAPLHERWPSVKNLSVGGREQGGEKSETPKSQGS